MNAVSQASSSLTSGSGEEQRIDVLTGDRCCVKCGFNLFGQSIVREKHYGLLMVRCPECGQAAALQEYPSLSGWLNRARFALAAAWLAVMFIGLAITALIVGAYAEGVQEVVIAPYVSKATTEFNTWGKANVPNFSPNDYGRFNDISNWWNQLDAQQLFADFGGWGALAWRGLYLWIYAAATLIPIGMIWSTFLARLRGLRLWLAMLVPTLIAASFLMESLFSRRWSWYVDPSPMIAQQVGWLPTLMTLLFALFSLCLGAVMGRRLLRGLLAFILPIQLLPAFRFLWLADGRPLPKTRSVARA